ncbi:unnamed protein product [Heligmosomoides polygyrus]|uniref:Alpha-carbonic anhydrase domain-containing protein n=1 Tax=Heligmosomoides polygyrus TaxID=6339 RepID=A0A183F3H3_HELPZ|nr:unnamed protein product [Heligmosomoides polygyrus]
MLPWLMTACIYPCVVGPDFWGLVNRDWRMCTAGQMQSPVNIDPAQLLFDPHLGQISIDDAHVEGTFENIGQLPIITINASLSKTSINITGGPALPYRYRLHQISIHFGHPDGERGSEHTVDRIRFPAEVQLLAYNIDLYTNYSQALTQPRGLLAIAVIVDIGPITEVALRRLTVASQSITYKGTITNAILNVNCLTKSERMRTALRQLHPAGLMPRTKHYVTYEGSLTIPGCHETVTWIIMNNPIYITREDVRIFAFFELLSILKEWMKSSRKLLAHASLRTLFLDWGPLYASKSLWCIGLSR